MSEIKINKNESTPKVSIMIISYNQEKFIGETISSAVLQNYDNLEIIISDDGSTDGTQNVIKDWQSRHPEKIIALLNKENVGVTKNCNRALKACSGVFIVPFGGDDLMLPGKITAQVQWFDNKPNRVMCGHSHDVISHDGKKYLGASRTKQYHGTGPELYIKHGMQLNGITLMVRKSAIPSHGFDELIPIASDFLFCIEVLAGNGEYGSVEGVYTKYRDSLGSVTKDYMKIVKDYNDTYLIVSERYPQYHDLCMDALYRHVTYFSGVTHLRYGNKPEARKCFYEAILKRPYYIKAWLRLLQTI